MLAFLFAVLLIHWADEFLPGIFVVIAIAAGIMLLNLTVDVPGFGFLNQLKNSDRLAIWIVLVTLAIIGYIHNQNRWIDEGLLNRPNDIGLWKSELILGISLATTLTHWLVGILQPKITTMDGQQFATEFALYVNFSGVALLLWSGDAVLSLSTLGAAIAALVVLFLQLDLLVAYVRP